MDAGSDFNGKIVVVTGAGSGIGRSSAMLFSKLGAKVHVADVNAESAESVVGELVILQRETASQWRRSVQLLPIDHLGATRKDATSYRAFRVAAL